jgi:hypothetical protein
MNTIQLKEWLSSNGFEKQGSDRYFAKPVGNGWYINVEWQGSDDKYPIVQATHITQFQPTDTNPYYVPFTADHTSFVFDRNEITVNKRYVRNVESRTFSNQLIRMAVKLLEFRLK